MATKKSETTAPAIRGCGAQDAAGCHGALSRDYILVRWKLRTSCQFAAGTNPLHGPTDVGVRHFVALSTLNIQHTVEFLLPLLLSPGGSDLRDCHCSRVDHHSCRLRALQTESSWILTAISTVQLQTSRRFQASLICLVNSRSLGHFDSSNYIAFFAVGSCS